MTKALYRKYRPKNLEDVVGQDHITSTLRNAIKKNRISHAYLFTGPRGVGKTSIARILAHEINNIPYDEESAHLDIIEIDAASNRRIDEVRDLRDKVHILPSTSKYKIYIIDEVHMLTREAFNALLKTLEEPPKHVIFILATTELHKLPDTIISRTQRFNFKPIEINDAKKQLSIIAKSEKISIDDEALTLLSTHGNGSFRDSISLLDQVSSTSINIDKSIVEKIIGIAPNNLIDSIIEALEQKDPAKLLDNLNKIKELGINPSSLSSQIYNRLLSYFLDDRIYSFSIRLLEDLINVGASTDPRSKLEVTLLKYTIPDEISNHNKHQTTTKGKVANSNITPKTRAPKDPLSSENNNQIKKIAKNSVSSDSSQNIEIENTSVKNSKIKEEKFNTVDDNISISRGEINAIKKSLDSVDEWWDKVLKIIKSDNNTLYGTLRLSKQKIESDALKLIFKFPLHAKKMSDSVNHKKLQNALFEATGHNISVKISLERDENENDQNHHADINVESSGNENELNSKDDSIINISNIFGGAELLDS